MTNKGTISLFVIIVLGLSIIMVLPIPLISMKLSSYDIIEYTNSFEYQWDMPASVESVNINTEIGELKIKYVEPSADYFAKIDIHIRMSGPGLGDKDCLDYFAIDEGNITEPNIDFSIDILSNITESEIDSLVENVSLSIFLRKGIIFNISTSIKNGNAKIDVPYNVQVNNLNINITNGNILFDLKNCIFEGNITGIVQNGNINFISYELEYTQNSVWSLSSKKTNIYITQSNPMNANISGYINTTEEVGTQLIYIDLTPEVGAKFTLYDYRIPGVQNGTEEGFDFEIVPEGINDYRYISDDFPTVFNYDLDLFLEGQLNFNLYSA